MSESTDPTTTPPAAEQAPEPSPSGPTPPWGTDSEFNPEKAWSLIQNLRSDLTGARASVEAVRKEATTAAEALTVKAQEAADARAEIEVSLHRERAARKFGLDAEQFEFLSELTDADAIEARAERLAAMTAKASRPVDPTQGSTAGGSTTSSTAEQFAAAVDGAFTR